VLPEQTTHRYTEPLAYTVKAGDPPRECVVCDQNFTPGDKVVLKALTPNDSLWAHLGCAHVATPFPAVH
jgi:hypothetical protein